LIWIGEFGVINFTKPVGLELVKVLGKGGQGIACLFGLTLPDGKKEQLVVKAAIKSDDIQAEVANVRASRAASAHYFWKRCFADGNILNM